jgi:hypothetical protein
MSGLISKSQLTLIVADQLLPLLMMIIGNSIVIIAIVKQSQNSLRLHAKAAHCFVSAAKLADVRRDILHRVTPLNGIIVGSVGAMTAAIVRILKLAGQYEYTGVFFGFFAICVTSSRSKNVKTYTWTYISSSTSPRLFVEWRFPFAHWHFSKGATMILLYHHINREQYGIGKIVATRVVTLLFALSVKKSFFLKNINGRKQEKLPKRHYFPAVWCIFCDFFASRRKIALSCFFARSTYQR